MKDPKVKEGFSESAWKSLVVKSLRIGWVQGLEKASTILPPSEVKTLIICGLFEDVFPAFAREHNSFNHNELNQILQEIYQKDWQALCSRDTHHGRGYADQFCDFEPTAGEGGERYGKRIVQELKQYTGLNWINPRVYNCLYTWRKIIPSDFNAKREPLNAPWKGMPHCILDGHTWEGKDMNNDCLLLSGHYENHRAIGKRVMKEGWQGIRNEFLQDKIVEPTITGQMSLF